MTPDFIPLIDYIWRKRIVTDPTKEARLMERYRRRYGTTEPPSKFIPMKKEHLEKRDTLSLNEINNLKEELDVSWTDIANHIGLQPSTLYQYRTQPEKLAKHMGKIIGFFVLALEERDSLEGYEVTDEELDQPPAPAKLSPIEEIDVMTVMHQELNKLDEPAQERVVRWLLDKFQIDVC